MGSCSSKISAQVNPQSIKGRKEDLPEKNNITNIKSNLTNNTNNNKQEIVHIKAEQKSVDTQTEIEIKDSSIKKQQVSIWQKLEKKCFAGESVWLNTRDTLRELGRDGTIYEITINPFTSSLSVTFAYDPSSIRAQQHKDIPFINYPIPIIHKLNFVPPALCVARRDLWSSEIFKIWLDEVEENEREKERIKKCII